ncbi:phosphoribosylamine--glycine ligase [Breznakiella homolactica]|uniref:Phosphoribosylamine--glycine ligase n=1 Tax=Breznakiella homolactica TaxID=2798577 RepID=A0A7T8BBN1_9SPIR|nr:phosphoribosylamine--glycine ligase [Breznakiella homolactica]QQO10566.1 phosphoribosylamine--glycine ligase [Breznakiella homolactica]
MKVLVIGSGGREHAICWKLAQSPDVDTVYAAPGNGGTAAEAKCENIPIPGGDPAAGEGLTFLLKLARDRGIAFTVVGPEAPLAEGIVDAFRAAGLSIVGPDKKAAELEASKAFSKSFMETHGVRAAKSETTGDLGKALSLAREHFSRSGAAPLVVKADGLAAGKGVVIAVTLEETEEALTAFMREKTLGDAGAAVVLEEFLEGREVSILAAVSVSPGKSGVILPFVSARDHKRRFDGAQGPNTGGMGSIAPVPDFTESALRDFRTAVLEPTLRGMEAEGMDYRGFIFFGLMVKEDRCSLLEYNVRLGDPETQAVLPLMDADFFGLCRAILDGSLSDFPLVWKPGAVCAPVAVAGGYPGAYRRGDRISVDEAKVRGTGAKIFIAGASLADDPKGGTGLYTSGGRVLAVSAIGTGGDDARRKAYEALEAVSFDGMAYRKDIGRE